MKTFFPAHQQLLRFGVGFLVILLLALVFLLSRNPVVKPPARRSLPSGCGDGRLSMHLVCHCPRSGSLLVPADQESSCSNHASARGPGQKVVAYSFYGQVDNKYFQGTEMNLRCVAMLYPGWTMRLYSNVSLDDEGSVAVLCRLWCTYPHFDVCQVYQLPAPLCDQTEVFGMVWRFFVLGDPLVDWFMIRDLDSEISLREVFAVQEWLESGRNWHTMRDHPNHYLPMLGGMWGGRNQNLNVTTAMRREIIRRGKHWLRGWDQDLLTEIVWPYANRDVLEHDSYRCEEYNHSDPWPTQRAGFQFVGSNFPWDNKGQQKKLPECPARCRPRQHGDWLYC